MKTGEVKGSRHYNDTWNIKYLKGFKWDFLTEKQRQDAKEHRSRMLSSIKVARKKQDFFMEKLDESKKKKAAAKRIQNKKQGKALESQDSEEEEEEEEDLDVNDYVPENLLSKRLK